MRSKRAKRILSLVLSIAMLMSQIGVPVLAQAAEVKIAQCEHHEKHTDECGYAEGAVCTHEHTDECNYAEVIAEKPCNFKAEELEKASDSDATEAAEHTHDENCGYAEAVEGTDCTHEHDGTCGFTADKPCTFTEEVCATCNPKDSGIAVPGISNITITAFDELEQVVQERSVDTGTTLAELNLPTTVAATGYPVTEVDVVDSGSLSNATPTPAAITIDVTWELNPKHSINNGNSTYDPQSGNYCFTPVLPSGYTLAEGVALPEIWVKVIVGEGAVLLADAAAHDISSGDLTLTTESECL